jgi:O-antigen/teichoic acid export membrane protein
VVDAGLASLGTFAVGIVAARYLDPAALGAYALFFAAFTALTVFATEGIFVPAEARSVSRPVSDRRHIIRKAVPVGLGSTLVVLPGLLIAYILVPDSVPRSVTVPLAVTTAATVIVAPLQEHVRRVCHLSRVSWRASIVSLVQFLVIVASLLSMLALDVAVAWIPFGALAIANTVSLVVGLALLAHDRRGELGLELSAADLIRSGRWLVTAAFIRSGSAFVASALIAQLASAEALGYAEAARVVGRPVLVVAMGLEAVLGPRSVEAALGSDRIRARRISTGFAAILAGVAVPYILLFGWDWAWNPVLTLIPTAYVVAGLVPVQVISDFLGGVVVPYRMELIGARREAALLAPETVGAGLQIVVGAAAGSIGAFARPIGALAMRAAQLVGYRAAVARVYRAVDEADAMGR